MNSSKSFLRTTSISTSMLLGRTRYYKKCQDLIYKSISVNMDIDEVKNLCDKIYKRWNIDLIGSMWIFYSRLYVLKINNEYLVNDVNWIFNALTECSDIDEIISNADYIDRYLFDSIDRLTAKPYSEFREFIGTDKKHFKKIKR